MEKVKQGYKQTDIGAIPEDWELVKIDNYIDFLTGFPFPSNGYANDGIRLVRGSNIKRGKTDWSEDITQYWKELSPELKPYILKDGDIVIAMDGSLVGRSFAQISNKDLPSLLLQRVARIRSSKIELSFLKEAICNEHFILHCDKVKTTSAIPHISPSDIKNYRIALPPTTKEQEAIATALSDINSLIDELTKLIDKKRAIKEGAMQQLLSPKKGWEEKELKQICWFQEGPGLRNWQFTSTGIKVINVTNLENGYLNLNRTDRHISLEEFEKMYRHFEIDENDIVVASSGNSYGKVSIVRKNDLPLLMNTSVIRFKPINKTNYNFLLMYLKSHLFKAQIDLMITGGAQPNFGPYHLNRISLFVPTNNEEQQAIGDTLRSMDDEIEALEENLLKYKAIKAGMMQQLLTGQIRLI